VLRRGFGAALESRGRVRVLASAAPMAAEFAGIFRPSVKAFESAGCDWGSTIAAAIGRRSVRDALEEADAEPRVHAFATALRGLYLADPEDLSALVAVEQVLADEDPGRVPIARVKRGAGTLAQALQDDSRCRVDLRHVVRAVDEDASGVAVSIEDPNGRRATARGHYLVAAVPPALLLDWSFSPALPEMQIRAFETLTSGPGTKVVMRFARRWWRRQGRPRAFATNLPVGAVWEAGETQQKAALLTLLAGGAASASVRALLRDGIGGVTTRLRWLGGNVREKPEFVAVSWEDERWSRGGYGVFGPGFDPALRDLLSRGTARIVFAGDHTSRQFQGYMNGAVESGLRAASDIVHLHRLNRHG
jgi:monoamine oxidase